jgi:hypothetical protein
MTFHNDKSLLAGGLTEQILSGKTLALFNPQIQSYGRTYQKEKKACPKNKSKSQTNHNHKDKA